MSALGGKRSLIPGHSQGQTECPLSARSGHPIAPTFSVRGGQPRRNLFVELVTEAAGRLQQAGIVTYSRGKIQVLDRKALEQRSCECYQAVLREYDRLISMLPWGT
jgi:hypothetical protein